MILTLADLEQTQSKHSGIKTYCITFSFFVVALLPLLLVQNWYPNSAHPPAIPCAGHQWASCSVLQRSAPVLEVAPLEGGRRLPDHHQLVGVLRGEDDPFTTVAAQQLQLVEARVWREEGNNMNTQQGLAKQRTLSNYLTLQLLSCKQNSAADCVRENIIPTSPSGTDVNEQ